MKVTDTRRLNLLVVGVALPLAGALVSEEFLAQYRFPGVFAHGAMEVIGALLALIALLLMHAGQVNPNLRWHETNMVAAALAAMSVLDLFHAATLPGNSFVWFHSLATFSGGGILLVLLFLNRTQIRIPSLLGYAIGAALLAGSVYWFAPALTPAMLTDGEFTALARFLNIAGGVGFWAASWYFWQRFLTSKEQDYFLLSAHCLLFGSAGLLFELSSLWDAAWWWWHILRLAAYLILVLFMIRAMIRRIGTTNLIQSSVTTTEIERYRVLAFACAGIAIAVAICVLIGWALNVPALIQIAPTFAPMQVNTAIGFLLGGTGLFTLAIGRDRWALYLGGLLSLLAGLTLYQYLAGVNLGIDEFFAKAYVNTKTSHPGRPAPNTATCFLLVGILLLIAPASFRAQKHMLLELLALSIFGMATIVAVGYAQDADVALTWGNLTRMAIHTATCFGVLGIGFISISWYRQRSHIADVPVWIPFALCIAVLIIDVKVPLGVAMGMAYAPLVFCSLWFRNLYTPFVFAGVATLLTVLGYLASADIGTNVNAVLANRTMAIVVVWIIAAIVFIQRVTQLRLSESQQRLSNIFEHVGEAMLTFLPDGRLDGFNDSAGKDLGFVKDDIGTLRISAVLPYEDATALLAGHQASARKESIARRRDGTELPVSLSLSNIPTEQGLLISTFMRDITDQKEAEERIAQYTLDLERSNRALDDFAYIASHDLKEPLRGMHNHARFLMEDYGDKLGEDGAKRIDRMITLASRQENLIRDLLYYSRLGRVHDAFQPIKTGALVADIACSLEEFLAENGARLDIAPDLPDTFGEGARVGEVFHNLIVNGIKYNRWQEKLVEIGWLKGVPSQDHQERTVFFVRDNGIGISPEFHEDIFKIFKRLNSEKEFSGGTGAGLTFVKKIIDMHQGSIWIESAPDQGTTFFFSFGAENEGV